MRCVLVLALIAGCVHPRSAGTTPQLFRPRADATISPPGLVTPAPPRPTGSRSGRSGARTLGFSVLGLAVGFAVGTAISDCREGLCPEQLVVPLVGALVGAVIGASRD